MAKDDNLYRQCSLSQGDKRLTAWIPVRGAIKGASVEVLDGHPKRERDFWGVDEVYETELTSQALRAKQAMDRGALLSIDRVR